MRSALIALNQNRTREALARRLEKASFTTIQTKSFREANDRLQDETFDLLFTELLVDGRDGHLLANLGCKRVVLVANSGEWSAADALPEGFHARITPPFQTERFNELLDSLSVHENSECARTGTEGTDEAGTFDRTLIGKSRVMRHMAEQLSRIAPADAPVLIHGETGTGKELVALELHHLSGRGGPFVAINCGAVSPALIESQLFGHERGSFTNASSRHRGVFERADGGTLFLDEVTEMPLELQSKLLRVLEEGAFYRIGGDRLNLIDVRAMAATNQDPRRAVRDGRLRSDLFYRLNVLSVRVPPLRERLDDVALLAESFLAVVADLEGGGPKQLADETLALLEAYPWPGNVRELRNVVYSAFLLSDGRWVMPDSLPPEVLDGDQVGSPSRDETLWVPLGTSLGEINRRLVVSTLHRMNGNKTDTAEVLGISLKTLYNRLHQYSLG